MFSDSQYEGKPPILNWKAFMMASNVDVNPTAEILKSLVPVPHQLIIPIRESTKGKMLGDSAGK